MRLQDGNGFADAGSRKRRRQPSNVYVDMSDDAFDEMVVTSESSADEDSGSDSPLPARARSSRKRPRQRVRDLVPAIAAPM